MQILLNESLLLTQIDKTHLPILFKWRNESSFINNCTMRPCIEDINKFENELKSDFNKDRHLQFVILWREEPVGTVFSYSFNKIDQYVFTTLFIDSKYANKSLGIRVFSAYSNFLFQEFNLFKIYFDIYEYNHIMVNIIEKCGFSLEGIFKKQHLQGGQRYDVRRYAFYEKDMQYWANLLKTNTVKILK